MLDFEAGLEEKLKTSLINTLNGREIVCGAIINVVAKQGNENKPTMKENCTISVWLDSVYDATCGGSVWWQCVVAVCGGSVWWQCVVAVCGGIVWRQFVKLAGKSNRRSSLGNCLLECFSTRLSSSWCFVSPFLYVCFRVTV